MPPSDRARRCAIPSRAGRLPAPAGGAGPPPAGPSPPRRMRRGSFEPGRFPRRVPDPAPARGRRRVAALPAAAAQAAVGDEIILARQPGLNAAERADVRADASVELERTLPIADVEVVSAPAGERAEALAALRADPDVAWAEPNRPRRIASTEPYWSRLWGLENTGQTVLGASGVADADIDAPEAWTLTKGRGVTVAVVDTGVAPHPDLSLVAGLGLRRRRRRPRRRPRARHARRRHDRRGRERPRRGRRRAAGEHHADPRARRLRPRQLGRLGRRLRVRRRPRGEDRQRLHRRRRTSPTRR